MADFNEKVFGKTEEAKSVQLDDALRKLKQGFELFGNSDQLERWGDRKNENEVCLQFGSSRYVQR